MHDARVQRQYGGRRVYTMRSRGIAVRLRVCRGAPLFAVVIVGKRFATQLPKIAGDVSRGSTALGQGRSTLAVLLNPLQFSSVHSTLHFPGNSCAPTSQNCIPGEPLAEVHHVHESGSPRKHAWTRRTQHNISRAIAHIWIRTRGFITNKSMEQVELVQDALPIAIEFSIC